MANIRKYMQNRQKSINPREIEDDEDYENSIRRHKRKVLLIILSALVVVFAIVLTVILVIQNKTYKDYSVEKTVNLGDTYGCRFYEFGGYALRYSNDGITYIDGDTTIWNQPFEMKTPLIDVCGSTVAIAESGGTTVYIYNKSGSLGQVATKYPIVSLNVATQGVVAVVSEDESSTYIEVYDRNGAELASGRTVLSGDGYPVDISISNDGTKMMAAFLYVEGSSVKTKVVFYNFTEVGKNEVDRIVGVFSHYGTTVVPKVEFISNNKAVAFGDDMLTIYSMSQKPSKVYEESETQDVKSVFYSDEYIGIVMETEELDQPYRVRVLTADGKLVFDKKVDIEYTGVKFDGDNVVLYNATEMMVISSRGRTKFDGSFDEEMLDVITTDKEYSYLAVTTSGIKEIKLK